MDAVTSQCEINIREKAMQEGLQKGKQKGEEKGVREGRKEEKILISRSILNEGFDVKAISKITGLTVEEVQALEI